MDDRKDLIVVMPVFNEAASIEKVIGEWMPVLLHSGAKFTLLVMNDGSTDATHSLLTRLQDHHGKCFEVINHPNRGHGQTCLEGYRIAINRNISFILQIDSDGQSSPAHFAAIWAMRNDFDVIYGKRKRSDGLRRVVASFVLRIALRVVARVDCVDANVPYRLMNTQSCKTEIQRIPQKISLANVALAVLLQRNPSLRHGVLPIAFPPRIGGEPSVPFRKFVAKAVELFIQMKRCGYC